MKNMTILVLVGAILGAVVASLVVPPALSWYSSPGGLPQGAQVQAIVQIPEVIRFATGHLIRGQLVGAGLGATLFLALGLAVTSRSRRASPPGKPASA